MVGRIDQSIITSAIKLLSDGELVAFPTETVYGLGADASNEAALRKLYTAKGRPASHPVIVHLFSIEQMNDWGMDLNDHAKKLAQRFWPGPLTLIVKKSSHVSPLVTGGQDTVALRVPVHPIALALLEAFAGGIAAPSANKYGRISSTCAQHVREELADQVSLIIDGGNCPLGIESTIVDTTGALPRILRPGVISEKDILECLHLQKLSHLNAVVQSGDKIETIRVPGSDKTHYAPRTPMFLMDKELLQATLSQSDSQESYAVLAFIKPDLANNSKGEAIVRHFIQASSDPKSYAHDLYNNLRQLDGNGVTNILVESVPESAPWFPIVDRLRRAATNC